MADEIAKCLNCDHAFGDSSLFCSQCGQKIQPLRVSLFDLLCDFADSMFQFDSKFFRSVRSLFWRPGFLTAEYLAGRRASYLRPVTLFLIVVGIFFLGAQWAANQTVDPMELQPDENGNVQIEPMLGIQLNFTVDELTALKSATVEDIRETIMPDVIEEGTWQEYVFLKLIKLAQADGIFAFRQRFTDASSRSVVLLIPMLALLIKLFHLRKRVYFVESVIFCLHLHTFFFSLLTLIFLLPSANAVRLPAMLTIAVIFWIYTALALSRTFEPRLWLAYVKSATLLAFHFFVVAVLAIFVVAFVVLLL